MDPGQIGTDGALGHGAVDGVFRGDEGVSGAVVAVDAIHHPALALGHAAGRVGGGKDGLRAIGVEPPHPGDGGAGLVGGDVFDVAQVNAVNAGEVGERIAAAEVQDETVCVSVFFSSSAKLDLTSSFSPMNRAGVWQPSQVYRAGRRLCTGDGIGVG